jgi:hypothetical protein
MSKLLRKHGYCAPLALQYVSGEEDDYVHEICTNSGFTPEWGMEDHEYFEAARELGVKFRRVQLKQRGLYRQKLSKFLDENPQGCFLIYTSNHLFVVDEGDIYDPLNEVGFGLDRLVTGAWKVFNKP